MIKIENLNKTYDGKNYILKDLSLEIKKGEYVLISGKSGSGKSTLLNTIGLLDSDFEGNLYVDGQNVSGMKDEDISKIRAEKIGFIFQSFNLIPNMTVFENIMLPLLYSRKEINTQTEKNIEDMMEKLSILPLKDKNIQFLSGGEKQRVAIARTMSNLPEIILADEPTGNLDKENADAVYVFLDEMHKSGKTIILVTHDYHKHIECDQIIRLEQGKII